MMGRHLRVDGENLFCNESINRIESKIFDVKIIRHTFIKDKRCYRLFYANFLNVLLELWLKVDLP